MTPMSPIAHHRLHRRANGRPGYSLVEAMVSVVIVGGMFAAAVHTLGAARLGEQQTVERARGHALAQAMIEEILNHSYEDAGGSATIGPEAGESNGTRSAFDDVDDYHKWSSSPPTEPDGNVLAGFDNWTRRAEVQRVRVDQPGQPSTSDTGLKRITVTVSRGEATLAEVVALRSRALDKQRPTGAIAP